MSCLKLIETKALYIYHKWIILSKNDKHFKNNKLPWKTLFGGIYYA